jgi:hypothetical protein
MIDLQFNLKDPLRRLMAASGNLRDWTLVGVGTDPGATSSGTTDLNLSL